MAWKESQAEIFSSSKTSAKDANEALGQFLSKWVSSGDDDLHLKDTQTQLELINKVGVWYFGFLWIYRNSLS